MPVPSTVNDLDPTASNNSPAGSEPIGPDLDAYLRAHAAIIRQVSDASNVGTQTHAATSKTTPVDADELAIADSAASFGLKKLTFANLKAWVKSAAQGGLAMTGLLKFAAGSNIASAATVNLTAATGNTVHITGTTGISAWTMTAGQFMNVIFDGILTLTHHATNNALPGAANVTTAAGDRAILYYDGTTTYVFAYQRANGTSLASSGGNQLMSLVTAVNTTSGTAIDFTGIPSWAKKVTVQLSGVSTNGTSNYQIQLGTSAGIVASGYNSTCDALTNAAPAVTASLSSGVLLVAGSAAIIMSGVLRLHLVGGAGWVAEGKAKQGTSTTISTAGDATLPGTLDRIRITTVNGTDTFDAGSISLLIEGY